MAKLLCVSWIPRSYIHLFETYAGLDKITLKISDVDFRDELTFKITGYGAYPEIQFTQEWSGLHYFVVELPGEGVQNAAVQFIRDMQELLMNEIFKKCHPVTFRQIASDTITLDFHVVIMSNEKLDVKPNFIQKNVGDLTVAYDPREVYTPGTTSYLFGSEDLAFKRVLVYHAYTEVACEFLMNMMKRMLRLYHEADLATDSIKSMSDIKEMKGVIDVMNEVTGEASESFGKMKQAQENFKLKLEGFRKEQFSQLEEELARALEVGQSLEKINVDASYMHIQRGDVLTEYLRNISSTINSRLMLYAAERKRGFFG
jgi:hypothetical protein